MWSGTCRSIDSHVQWGVNAAASDHSHAREVISVVSALRGAYQLASVNIA